MLSLPQEKKQFVSLSTIHAVLFSLCFVTSSLSTTLSGINTIALLITSLLIIHQERHWQALKIHPTTKYFGLMALIVIFGMLYGASGLGLALKTAKKYLWLVTVPIFCLSLTNISRENLLKPFLATVIITSVTSFYDFMTTGSNASPFFKDHLVQSLILTLGLGLFAYEALFRKSKPAKVYFFITAVLGVDLIMVCESLSGYILFLTSCLFISIAYARYKQVPMKKALILGLCIATSCALAIIFSPTAQKRVEDFQEHYHQYSNNINQYNSVGTRINDWKIGAYLFKQKPFFGYGTGGLQQGMKVYVKVFPNKDIYPSKLIDTGYLNILSQYGIVGLSIFLFCFYQLWRMTKSLSHFESYIVKFIFAILAVMLFINPWLTSSAPTHLIALLLAYAYSDSSSENKAN